MSANNTSSKGKELYLRFLNTHSGIVSFCNFINCNGSFAVTDTAFAALIKPLLDGSFVEKDRKLFRCFHFY